MVDLSDLMDDTPRGDSSCGCYACASNLRRMSRMILCDNCGNKRCPHSTDHRNACTGSNDPGQHGSRYGDWQESAP